MAPTKARHVNSETAVPLRLSHLILATGLLLVLLPPIHWMASGAHRILGVPKSLLYLLGSSTILMVGIVAAWWIEETKGPTR